MTIKEYKKGFPQELQAAIDAGLDIWSNEACVGYVVAACDDCGLSVAQKEALLSALWRQFDRMDVDEAISRAE